MRTSSMPDARFRCLQCGAAARRLFEAHDLNRKVTDAPFSYYRCPRCSAIFLHPVPEDLGRFYPPGYHAIPRSLEELMEGKHHELFKLEAIGAEGRGRQLLEIGPSYGRFSALARDAGFKVTAIEMDEACCRYLKDLGGISVVQASDVLAALKGLGAFDVITMWHSIEHLPDPWSVLDALPSHLAPGGLLAIVTPNLQSLQFRMFGRYWVHLDAPRHVWLIPLKTLQARLRQAGMQMAHSSTADQGAIDCNSLSWLVSPGFKFPKWMFRNPFLWVGIRLRTRLIRVEKFGSLGSSYTAVFRKA